MKYMKIKFFIFCFILFIKILSIQILQKYSSVKVQCSTEKNIAFDSSGFNLYENMFFSFDLDGNHLRQEIYIEFYDEIDEQSMNKTNKDGKPINPTSSSQTTKNGEISSMKKSYTIYKDEEKNYVGIGFDCGGTLTIKNTKEDEGNKGNTILIILVVVLVVAVIVAVIISCIRRKKAREARAAMRMQMAAGGYYPGMNMGMSVGMGMPAVYGSNYMMNNMPPQPGLIGSQPVAYSRMPNDATQIIDQNSPNPNENPPSSELRIKGKKV